MLAIWKMFHYVIKDENVFLTLVLIFSANYMSKSCIVLISLHHQ